MSSRRLLALALSSALLTGGAVSLSPGAAAAPAPTPQQLADANRRVEQAREGLGDVQEQAEAAAEAYNGAQGDADDAAAAAVAAAAAAAQSQVAADQARAEADAAQGVADAAASAAVQARQEHERAVAATVAAQEALDQLASGAYRSGGNLALLSTMLAADPVTFATGQAMINRVDEHQKDSVDAFAAAKQEAAASAARADQAEATATALAGQVAERAAAAASTAAAARASATSAATAAAVSAAAASQAAAAKQHALVLVAAAEQALGSASAVAADLTAKAEQARREAAAAARRLPAAAQASNGSAASTAIAAAFRWIGTPYAWGGGNASGPTMGFAQGAGTRGFDCSGLTLYAYAQAGIRLPHNSGAQYASGPHVGRADLAPGDLVFYGGPIHHVGLYIGNGQMIEAPHTGDVVKVSSVDRRSFVGGMRPTG